MDSGQKYLFQPTIGRRSRERRSIEDCQVGFPIRTSRDQRVLSPPPGLSQSATSFIASCCQGIHQTPFSRLIRSRRRRALLCDGGSKPSTHPLWLLSRKSFDPRHPGSRLGRRRQSRQRSLTGSEASLGQCILDLERLSLFASRHDPAGPKPHMLTATDPPIPHSGWTQERLVYLLSERCQFSDLATGLRGASNDAPGNLVRTSRGVGLVEPTGIEPVTLCLQSRCSPS